MKKRTTPIITHTEILARAIRTIEADIEEVRIKCKIFPGDQAETMFAAAADELMSKLEALKQLYLIETGANID